MKIFNLPFSVERDVCVLSMANVSTLIDFEKYLSDEELNRFYSMKSEERKSQYCLARIVAKKSLEFFVGKFDFRSVTIANETSGCPVILRDGKKFGYAVSIAHTKETVAGLVFKDTFSFGIDIESMREKSTKAMRHVIMDGEQIPDDPKHLTVAWTLKEALSKALKKGFLLPFSELELTLTAETDNLFSCVYKKHPEFKGMSMIFNRNVFAMAYFSSLNISLSQIFDLPPESFEIIFDHYHVS